jgi:hypothetical protein
VLQAAAGIGFRGFQQCAKARFFTHSMTLPRALGSVGAIDAAAQTPVARAFEDEK